MTLFRLSEMERNALRPPEHVKPSEWAERHVVLGRGEPRPGRWRNRTNPMLIGPMNVFATPGANQVTLIMGTQAGKTSVEKNLLGWAIDCAPGPIIWVVPRDADIEHLVEERIRPVLDLPRLQRHLTGRVRDLKTQRWKLATCDIWFAAATSPADLASRPRMYLFGDECDKWPGWSGTEADPLSLARERLKWFGGKQVIASTPTTRDGLIWRQWELSDQRRFHVPCPACGRFQVLKFEHVQFDGVKDPEQMRVERPAWYQCSECAGRIDDRDKMLIMQHAVWCPEDGEVTADGEVRGAFKANAGFHATALTSPVVSFSQMAAEFLEANTPAAKMNFVNSWLAEIWEEQVDAPTKKALSKCVAAYPRDAVPDGVRWVTMGVDPGKGRMHYVVRGWGVDFRSWLIRCGIVQGWEALDHLVSGHWGSLRVTLCGIDMRNRTDEVIAFHRRHAHNTRLFLGTELKEGALYSTERVDRHPITGAPYRDSPVRWNISVSLFKDMLARGIRTGVGSEPNAWHVHTDPPADYLAHLTSEHKVLRRTRASRARRAIWVQKGERSNHYWDCENYALTAAYLAGVHQWTSERVALRDGGGGRRRRRSGRPDWLGDL